MKPKVKFQYVATVIFIGFCLAFLYQLTFGQ